MFISTNSTNGINHFMFERFFLCAIALRQTTKIYADDLRSLIEFAISLTDEEIERAKKSPVEFVEKYSYFINV